MGNLGITYGGQVTLLTYDMQQQFVAFFASLRYILDGTYSPFFNWGVSLGGNYMGLIAYYMASPLSWITLLWNLESMPDAIYVLTLLKIGLCGLTFAIFTRFGLAEKKCNFINVVFSCCYALMSYNIMYSMSLMWLDGVILLPIILLGVEQLLKGKKGFVYFASMAALFLCNYYISYMVGIFAAAYVVCRAFSMASGENWKATMRVLIRFGINTLLALGIAMPLLLPAVKSIETGYGTGAASVESATVEAYDFTVLELVKKLLPMQYDSVENAGLPSIYCGSVMLGLAFFFFLQKRYGIREKLCYAVLLLLPVTGFLNQKIDYVWHAFRYPNSFTYRYAFLFSTVVLILAWRSFEGIPRETQFARLLTSIGVCYICAELFFNGSALVSGIHKEVGYSVRNGYDTFLELYYPLSEKIREDEEFARTEVVCGYMPYNATMLFGLNGVSGFTSTYNGNVYNFLGIIGGENQGNSVLGKQLTPLGDSLLGVKYRITPQKEQEGYILKSTTEIVTDIGTARVYLQENPLPLSLGYAVLGEKLFQPLTLSTDPYSNQNVILEQLGAEASEVFYAIPYESTHEGNGWNFEFTVPSDDPVYFYVNAVKDGQDAEERDDREINVHVSWDGETQNYWVNVRNGLYLGRFPKGSRVILSFEEENLIYYDSYLYRMDMEQYEKAVASLQKKQLQVSSYKGGHIQGTVTAEEGETLFTTIPVGEGYQVKVDGKESPYGMALGTFLTIDLQPGEHQIEISYISPGFLTGVRICIIALLATLIYFLDKSIFNIAYCTKRKNSVK
ncbi:MAG: YfhO family protein [Lachnospiraceae bacterium]|nr:YfhO family protein [Lachnospiraceae bacterium]